MNRLIVEVESHFGASISCRACGKQIDQGRKYMLFIPKSERTANVVMCRQCGKAKRYTEKEIIEIAKEINGNGSK